MALACFGIDFSGAAIFLRAFCPTEGGRLSYCAAEDPVDLRIRYHAAALGDLDRFDGSIADHAPKSAR